MQKLFSRAVPVVAGAALAAVALAAGPAAPARAEPVVLGTLALTPTSGSVADNPFVTSATTPGGCPSGYGQNASLRVGPVGSPTALLNRIGSAGGYDTVTSITFAANRSLTTALGGAAADGSYEVAVVCSGVDGTLHPKNYSTVITVTGGTWQVKPAEATSTRLAASPGIVCAGDEVTLTAAVTPAAAGTVEFLRGTASLGTAEVDSAKATLTTTALPAGLHRLTARFVPDDPRAYAASTSRTAYVYVRSQQGGISS